MSIATYLSKAKQSLSRSLSSKGQHPASFVIGNESADLDSIICALVYGYIQSSTATARKADKCLIPVANIPADQLRLRPELTALLKHANLKPLDLITLEDLGKLHDTLPPKSTEWTLVDHNVLQGTLGEHYMSRVTGAIDHHDDEGKVPPDAHPRVIAKTGSCTSHVVNFCRSDWDSISSPVSDGGDGYVSNYAAPISTWDAQVAKLALGSILIDTVNFIAEDKVTEHDRVAVEYLEAKIAASSELAATYDRDAFFKDVNEAKSNLDDLSVVEILEKDYKQWKEGELTLGISSCVRSIKYLQAKEEDLTPVLLKFATERRLDLYAIMNAHNENSAFERQLLLLAVNEGKARETAAKFVDAQSTKLELHESSTKVAMKNAPWLKLWEQKNLGASRLRTFHP